MPDTEKLLGAISAYADTAYGADTIDGELSRQRALALDAYQGKNIEPAPDGRSQVIDWAVFETVQWILPSLLRIFAGGDDVVEFDPTGPEDEEVAKQESTVLNYLVTQKNNWFLTCLEWFQDALVTKNAYCMAFMDEKLDTEIERYENQSEEQVTLLLQDDVEIVGQEQFVDEEEQGPLIDPIAGQPVPPEAEQEVLQTYQAAGMEPQFAPVLRFNVEVKKTKAKKKLTFQVLPPERCLVAEDTPDFTLADCHYFEYFDLVPISELRRMGFEIEDDISDDDFSESMEDTARDEPLASESLEDYEGTDPSMRRVKVRTIWIRHDYDEDGIAELNKVLLVGETILELKHASRIPVACIVPFLNTHRHMGVSVADLVFDIQRIKTAMLRSGIDSLYLANNPRHVVSKKVNLDDMLVSRPGGIVRLAEGSIPGEGHVLPLQTENTFPFAQQGLEHMDRVVESRVGVNRMFQGIDSSNINDHDRVGQLSTMASQRIEMIARIFANGVERLFSIAHELLIKSGHSKETMRLNGDWVDIDPSQWKTGRDMRIVAPFAAGNKDALVQRLLLVANIHEKALASGLSIVQVDDSYELAKDLAQAADLSGDRYFTDPRTVPPPEPPPDHTMIALEIEKQKADDEAEDEARKAELESFKVTANHELERFKAELAADVDRFRAELQSSTQLAIANAKASKAE